ncbi:hypothetical protein LINPERHAP2_LOCUS4447 [Linum perenne]
MLKLNHILLKKPEPIPDNSNDVKWRHFKNCLGALDGSHINVRVPLDMQTRYRDRKGNTSINILGVCTPKLEFIYCLSGWEGSAHDGRVLRDALARPNGLKVPEVEMVKRARDNGKDDQARDYFPWNDKMDDAFISCLRDLVKEGHIENGSCKQGVFKEIENMMELKIKGCGVKALPHVRSRLTHFKKKFGAMHMMRSESGFGWNEAKQCIEVDDDVFKEYVKVTLFYVLFSVFCSAGVVVRWVWLAVSLGFGWNVDGIWSHPSCAKMNNKPFPHYDDLLFIFGKNRATGSEAMGANEDILSPQESEHLEEDFVNIQDTSVSFEELMQGIINEGGTEANQIPTEGVLEKIPIEKEAAGQQPSKKSRRKSQGDVFLSNISMHLSQLEPILTKTADAIGHLVREDYEDSTKRKEAEDAATNKRKNVFSHLEKIEGLSRIQAIAASRRLVKDDKELQLFFDFEDDADRLAFVLDLLG